MTGSPRVSCIVPVWNGERYVAAAIESILSQDRVPDEIVIVDDGSTDDTPAILESFGAALRVVRIDNGGAPRALNVGIAASTGDVLTFCDADDLLASGAIALRLPVLVDEAIDAVFGSVEQFLSPDLPPDPASRIRFASGPRRAELSGTMLCRRSVFARFGPFDERRRAGHFVAWFASARRAGIRTTTIDDVVLRRRLHETNMSRTTGREGNRDLLAVVREHHRRRSGSAQ